MTATLQSPAVYEAVRAFASRQPLPPEALATAPLRSLPRPSLLLAGVDLPPRAREAAATLGIATAGDLLEHLPHSHRDRRETRSLSELKVG